MLSNTPENKKNEPSQTLRNGSAPSRLQKPLPLTDTEKRILKCRANLAYLYFLSFFWEKKDVKLLTDYYRKRLAYYQSKIDTDNAWLIEVSSPNSL